MDVTPKGNPSMQQSGREGQSSLKYALRYKRLTHTGAFIEQLCRLSRKTSWNISQLLFPEIGTHTHSHAHPRYTLSVFFAEVLAFPEVGLICRLWGFICHCEAEGLLSLPESSANQNQARSIELFNRSHFANHEVCIYLNLSSSPNQSCICPAFQQYLVLEKVCLCVCPVFAVSALQLRALKG